MKDRTLKEREERVAKFIRERLDWLEEQPGLSATRLTRVST